MDSIQWRINWQRLSHFFFLSLSNLQLYDNWTLYVCSTTFRMLLLGVMNLIMLWICYCSIFWIVWVKYFFLSFYLQWHSNDTIIITKDFLICFAFFIVFGLKEEEEERSKFEGKLSMGFFGGEMYTRRK